jgi:tRNA (mo5U34)-methyltransferase
VGSDLTISAADMDAPEIEKRIAAFRGWPYEFVFDGGVRTQVADRSVANRQRERYRYFFAALLKLSGGSLSGRRVLDLGCSAGFWSLSALEAGAEFVLGVDAQQRAIDQAELVFAAKGIDPARYRFQRADVFEQEISESFDVVLCLGLLDHVTRPFELFEAMSRSRAELLVIDTAISRARLSLFELARLYKSKDALEYPFALIPSREAVVELAGHFGFQARALAPEISDYAGMSDYRRQRRLAFICSNGAPLEGLAAAADRSPLPWWVRDPRALFTALR